MCFFNIHIPNKIKTFAWKACRNILPTKENLCLQHVIDEATCEACVLVGETMGHLFWDCNKVRETWELFGIAFDRNGLLYKQFVELI